MAILKQTLLTAVIMFSLVGVCGADPLDSLELDENAKVLRKGILAVPNASETLPGMAGADISVTSRGFFAIDFAVKDKRDLTVMLLTQDQKLEVAAGKPPTGDPLLRFDIEGPETAGQSARVTSGKYYLVFLNRGQAPAEIVYRASVRPY